MCHRGSALSFSTGVTGTFLFHTSFQHIVFSVGETCSAPLPGKGEQTVSVVCGKPLSLKLTQPSAAPAINRQKVLSALVPET